MVEIPILWVGAEIHRKELKASVSSLRSVMNFFWLPNLLSPFTCLGSLRHYLARHSGLTPHLLLVCGSASKVLRELQLSCPKPLPQELGLVQ